MRSNRMAAANTRRAMPHPGTQSLSSRFPPPLEGPDVPPLRVGSEVTVGSGAFVGSGVLEGSGVMIRPVVFVGSGIEVGSGVGGG